MWRTPLLAALAVLAVALPPPAAARDGDEVRTRAACAGARVELRVRAEDEDGAGELRLEVRVERSRPGAVWRLALLRERRLVFAGARRAGATGALQVRRVVPDWPGRETVAARVTAPSGRTCSLTASI